MKFLKQVLAVITGIFAFLFLIVAFFFFVGMIGSLFTKSPIQKNTVLVAKFNTEIEEKVDQTPFEEIPVFSDQQKMGLNDIIKGIDKAKHDKRIEGIYLELSDIPAGFASVEAIRNELISFKESGKWVYAYGENISQKAYYLASVADTIIVNPKGIVDFRGFASKLSFFKNALDKLGIKAQVFKVGDYKSAVEPFVLTKMSDENRTQIRAFLDDFYSIFLNGIADGRNKTVDELMIMAEEAKIQNAEDAVQQGLADISAHKSDVLSLIGSTLGFEDEKEKINFVSLKTMKAAKDYRPKKTGRDRIAVVYAYGSIVDGPGKNGTIGSYDYQKVIRKLRFKKNVKAAVIRVNSGGGSALASEIIWDEIERLKEKMPVVVSMGDYAASGGYYIACNSDKIFAEKNTLTGSIGVFGIFPNMKEFWNDKIGITFDTEKTAKYADIMSLTRPVTRSERVIIQNSVNDIYATFLARVAAGRDMEVEKVHEIARGRVWSGLKAQELGLVDEIGGLNDAIKAAAELADIEKYRISNYPSSDDPFEKFFGAAQTRMKQHFIEEELGIFAKYHENLKEIINMKGFQARIPFVLDIE